MTYRDPDDPRKYANPDMSYRDSSDPMGRTHNDPARMGAGNTASTVGALVVIVLIAAAIAYATNRSSPQLRAAPARRSQRPPRLAKEGWRDSSQAAVRIDPLCGSGVLDGRILKGHGTWIGNAAGPSDKFIEQIITVLLHFRYASKHA